MKRIADFLCSSSILCSDDVVESKREILGNNKWKIAFAIREDAGIEDAHERRIVT